MPKLSDTMTVGTVAAWLKNEGDEIASGDVIAEIETDKATMELEAFEDGVLLKQIAKVGEQVAIGQPIAAIGKAGEKVDVPSKGAAPKKEPKEEAKPAEAEADEDKEVEEEAEENAEPEAEKPEKEEPADDKPAPSEKRIKASPLARKIAKQEGVDLSSLKGTGPGGRIVKADVLQAKKAGGGATAKKTAPAAPAAISGMAIAEDADIRVSNMRGIIAKRLVESKTTAPHFYLEIEIDAAKLLATRQQVNDDLAKVAPENGGGVKFTVNDFILKATAEALRRVPAMNRSWHGETIRQHGSVHLAFGVAIDEGLLTPVIRNAESKTLKQIASEARELIAKARSKKLSPDQMSGSTFTVTNLGMFGISSFYGIINTPNAGILSVGATLARPVVNAAGEIVAGQVMTIGLSGDHRVVDGAVGAQFLQALKAVLETPALALI